MNDSDIIDSFYDSKIQKKSNGDDYLEQDNREAKYVIEDEDAFDKGRKLLGGLIRYGMKATGGTDIDWVIEHRGNFLVLEFKELHNEQIGVRLGQMLAYEKLHEKLNQVGKCYMYFVGCGYDLNFDNSNDYVWIFEMTQWKNDGVPFNTDTHSSTTSSGRPKKYFIHKDYMNEIKLGDLKVLIDNHWDEFER